LKTVERRRSNDRYSFLRWFDFFQIDV